MQLDLTGKIAIVTGAGRGIGKAIITTLAEEGITVVGVDVNPAALNDLQNELAGAGHRSSVHACDVRSAAETKAVIEAVVAEYGRVDILVNNAGVLKTGPIETYSEEDWDLTFDVNTKGLFLMCQAVIPVMKRQRYGRIINAASFAAIVPSTGSAAYAASKSAVESFTRTLAGELGPWDITVNCYAPGMIPTEMNHFAEMNPAVKTRLMDTLTLRRWGDKLDVARLICFLASDAAAYITGTMIDVSGGKFATQIPRNPYEAAAAAGEYEFGEA
jgi:3-oxoacyl-[acyl-carrier protein] reductase